MSPHRTWEDIVAAFALVAFAAMPAGAVEPVHKVGAVTWHAKSYVGKTLSIEGYLLEVDAGYVLFSDEPAGSISAHDLPVTGEGIGNLRPNVKYRIIGRFVRGGLVAGNGNPYHFELSATPTPEV